MIIDLLDNCARYTAVHKRMDAAFHFLQTTDLQAIEEGKHPIDSEDLFAIVQKYETLDSAHEEMESHRKYIDVQYMIDGAELIGLTLLKDQTISKEYSAENDFTLYADDPSFFTKMSMGTFMVFFPTDLHMPGIKINEPAWVKKIVVKVKV